MTQERTSHTPANRKSRWGPCVTEHGVHYSVWAPERSGLEVHVQPATGSGIRALPLVPDSGGFHHVLDPAGREGDRYQFLVNGMRLPDPASRAQAGTVHESSLVVGPSSFRWSDHAWQRPDFRDVVIYELHVGTFTPAGTFRGAIEKLPYLHDLGVNAIELMPIADFPGNRSWGYDGVLIYAPARAYGSPDDLRALIDAAHAHGLAVILDAVYNHFGPDGNYLGLYSARFSTPRHHTPWGAGFNFDDEDADPVREFFVGNPVYWMDEFHFDGFRLDATHEIADDSPKHILAEMAEAIHARGGYVIGEDARNKREMLLPRAEGGMGFDAVWADDFHHIARVSQTRDAESYFQHYRGTPGELADTLQHGWHYRGQRSPATGTVRGSDSVGLPPSGFLHCISNHDQVGNRAFGQRLSDSITPAAYRALSMLLCLSPYTPMLFMGQEWAASTPFLFFTDHHAELGRLITEGRRREFSGFADFRDPATRAKIPDPQAEDTFQASKLDWAELSGLPHTQSLALYRECLALRRANSAFRPSLSACVRAEVISGGIVALRLFGPEDEFFLALSLGAKGTIDLNRESLATLSNGKRWSMVICSEEPRFGGSGRPRADGDQLVISGPTCVVFSATN